MNAREAADQTDEVDCQELHSAAGLWDCKKGERTRTTRHLRSSTHASCTAVDRKASTCCSSRAISKHWWHNVAIWERMRMARWVRRNPIPTRPIRSDRCNCDARANRTRVVCKSTHGFDSLRIKTTISSSACSRASWTRRPASAPSICPSPPSTSSPASSASPSRSSVCPPS